MRLSSQAKTKKSDAQTALATIVLVPELLAKKSIESANASIYEKQADTLL